MPRDLFNVDDSQMSQALPQVGALPLLSGLPQGGAQPSSSLCPSPFGTRPKQSFEGRDVLDPVALKPK